MLRPQIAEFLEARGMRDYEELYAWSIRESAAFWAAFRDWAGLPPEGAPLNFAEELLRGVGSGIALQAWNEAGEARVWTGEELRQVVAAYQRWMMEEGISPGDRVAAYLPNWPETMALMLAATGLGAIWSSCSPDFGAPAVLDRFGQVEPKLIVSTKEYRFAGKTFALGERLEALRRGLAGAPRIALVEELPREGDGELRFARQDPRAPLFILFSSGTTGLPKCIVHSAGGTLVQILKEIRLHADVRPGERLFYYTTCGWMMWNWLAVGLAAGASLVLYDGSPFYPGPETLWTMAERWRIEHFGTSAKYLALLEKQGYRPRERHELKALRQILSTGSPLAPQSFDFVEEAVKPGVHLASISGGTDIVSCFVLGNPLRAVRRGEIQGAGLGMDVQVWDEDGKRIWDRAGELVCVNRFPSMPLGFWQDEDGAKYRAAYFERFPGVWRHGDWARQNSETGGFVIYGRSDTTLNPGGVRIGSAEIYRQVEKIEEVMECVAVGQPWEGDERIILFVRLGEGVEWSEELGERIRGTLRREASPHHVPKKILVVRDLPRTISGKVSETAVRDAIAGREIRNVGALANPESIKEFQGRPELLS